MKKIRLMLKRITDVLKRRIFLLRKHVAAFIKKLKCILKAIPSRIYAILLKVSTFIKENWVCGLFIVIALSLIATIIWMIVLGKMQEIDVSIKYLLYPVYMLTAVFFGSSAKYIRDKKRIIIRRREIDSRWAKTEEIIKRCAFVNPKEGIIEGAGIPIITDSQSTYVDNSEAHTLIIGSTGSGKTRKIILPQINFLRLNKESIIVTDPKGELFESTSGAFHADGYRVVVLNFRDPLSGDAWNPLDIPYHYYLNEKKLIKQWKCLMI